MRSWLARSKLVCIQDIFVQLHYTNLLSDNKKSLYVQVVLVKLQTLGILTETALYGICYTFTAFYLSISVLFSVSVLEVLST